VFEVFALYAEIAGESLVLNRAEAKRGQLDNRPSLPSCLDHNKTIVQWPAVDTFKGLLFALGAMTSPLDYPHAQIKLDFDTVHCLFASNQLFGE
jgi:hypothetical protein